MCSSRARAWLAALGRRGGLRHWIGLVDRASASAFATEGRGFDSTKGLSNKEARPTYPAAPGYLGPPGTWAGTTHRRDLPRWVGGVVLHLPDLLGGPLAELLGLDALGAAALRQEVVDGLHVDHAQHVRAEGGQQVPAKARE